VVTGGPAPPARGERSNNRFDPLNTFPHLSVSQLRRSRGQTAVFRCFSREGDFSLTGISAPLLHAGAFAQLSLDL
jgi:hypothetical protein